MKINIIGGGIGGLTTAIAFRVYGSYKTFFDFFLP
jgi:2-polyprenyl-6-methoxyphenol hydroxylase-like FAD-dependent oxidoreductase